MIRKTKRIVVAGGTGQIGRALIRLLAPLGYRFTVLSRSGRPMAGASQTVRWLDGSDDWKSALPGCLAVVNLCGSSIDRRWTDSAKSDLRESRLEPTRLLGAAIQGMEDPPLAWLQASATGIYGDTGQEEADESAPNGSGFLAELCREWEGEARRFERPDVPLAFLRTGVVLGRDDGYLPKMLRLTRRGLGGRAGAGRQWISWIHEEDEARAIAFVLDRGLAGVFNLAAPEPVQQRAMSGELVNRTSALIAPPAPEFVVRPFSRLLGTEPSLVLGSCRALPRRLTEEGFRFRYPSLRLALDDLLAR